MEQGSKDNLPPPNIAMGRKRYLGKGAFVDAQVNSRARYFRVLAECLAKTEAHDELEQRVQLEDALGDLARATLLCHRDGNKVIFIGNGGSAAIASHMAIDWSKNGGRRSWCFTDAAAMTCMANDFGYHRVYSQQLEYHARAGDVLVIVSTSGRSLNLVEAARQAPALGLRALYTFTGMNPNNSLRDMGRMRFYVPCTEYGLVELSHCALLHSIVSVPLAEDEGE